jgi:hypothetical protein
LDGRGPAAIMSLGAARARPGCCQESPRWRAAPRSAPSLPLQATAPHRPPLTTTRALPNELISQCDSKGLYSQGGAVRASNPAAVNLTASPVKRRGRAQSGNRDGRSMSGSVQARRQPGHESACPMSRFGGCIIDQAYGKQTRYISHHLTPKALYQSLCPRRRTVSPNGALCPFCDIARAERFMPTAQRLRSGLALSQGKQQVKTHKEQSQRRPCSGPRCASLPPLQPVHVPLRWPEVRPLVGAVAREPESVSAHSFRRPRRARLD